MCAFLRGSGDVRACAHVQVLSGCLRQVGWKRRGLGSDSYVESRTRMRPARYWCSGGCLQEHRPPAETRVHPPVGPYLTLQ